MKFCRACNSKNIQVAINYGKTPIEDNFVIKKQKDKKQKLYPLCLYKCRSCQYLGVDAYFENKKNMHILYQTNTSPGLKNYYFQYAKKIKKKFGDKIFNVDIWSNDGTLVNSFQKLNIKSTGVEPNKLISKIANKNNNMTINSVFNKKVTKEICNKFGKADIITANYVFANIDNLDNFLLAIQELLSKNGTFIIQTGYHPRQLKLNMFDYAYHEHLSYFSLYSINKLLKRFGFNIYDLSFENIKQGSIRVYASRNPKKISNVVNKSLKQEQLLGVHRIEYFYKLELRLKNINHKLLESLSSFKNMGYTIIGFGASPSTTTLIYYFNLAAYIEYIVDDNPIKHNRYSPGYKIPVFETKKMYEEKKCVILILAWQQGKIILNKHKSILKSKNKFLIPLPRIKIIEK